MANNNWNNYTEKTATPVDADEVMVRDSADGKNKKLLFGTFWKWVAKKLNEATISELQTSNKTIVGALNQLNSDSLKSVIMSIGGIQIKNSDPGFAYYSDSIKANIPEGATIVAVILCGGFSAGVMISSVNKNDFTLSCNNSCVASKQECQNLVYITTCYFTY